MSRLLGLAMLFVAFLTDLDERARVKGSRDPLGAQAIWTHFGHYVVGNLTTVTSLLRDFTTLLLGCYFAERVAREKGPGSELETFLNWEQLAAYSRALCNNDYEFCGTERVRKPSGIADAVAVDGDGPIEVVVDWKSDIEMNTTKLTGYCGQLEAYRKSAGVSRALLVMMTS